MHVSADAVGLWRMFEPDFKGQVELIAVELKKGFNLEILKNFRVPSKAVLEAPVPGDARGVLADLGKFEKRVPKKTVEKKTVKKTVRGRGKGSVEGSAAPSSVFEAAGSGAAAGGTAVVPPVVGEKRGPEQKAAGGGEPKRRRLQTRRVAPVQKKPAVVAESRDAGYSFFDIPASPPHTAAAGAGVLKEKVAPKEPAAPFAGPGDDISNDPAACKEILGGLGTPFEVERARAAPRELRVNQLSSMLLEKDKATFEKQKQTSEWAAAAQLKQVRTLAKLLADERKSWNEKMSNERKKWNASWAKQNDILFHARQELTNAKAANATLSQEKAAAEAISVKALQAKADALKALEEVKEAGARASKAHEEAAEKESRASKALEEANAERIRLGKVVESLQAEVQAREVVVTDLTTRVSAAEKRADAAAEAKDALVSSFNQLEADREWLRTYGIARIVEAIMNAPKTSSGLDLVKERAREAGFKAGFNRCIGHINVLSAGGYTDQDAKLACLMN
ncbi:uncharacterized protein LOC110876787 [Helianthus annuus]|uniref:uncharacterized protein LOC110876787 n=1 Tax=Helianthus annuus TaxID=4232 RepID=UPI0016532AB1|nr:uncharacterized protein LOC110876787 [Helianthus annuus]